MARKPAKADGPGKPGLDVEMDQAWAETEAIIAADPSRIADPTLPFFRLNARRQLEEERARYEAGDLMAMMGALRKCAAHGVEMPDWLAQAFIERYDRVLNCHADSWDEVFGRPYPKGTHLASLRKRRIGRIRVLMAVRDARSKGKAIDGALFESVGKELGYGKTLTADLYYEAKKRWPFVVGRLPGKTKK